MRFFFILGILLSSLISCSTLNNKRSLASIALKPNEEVLRSWETNSGEKRLLIHESIASKAKILKLRKVDLENNIHTIILESEATTELYGKSHFNEPWLPEYNDEPRDYLYKYSLKNRQKFKIKITNEDDWPCKANWIKVPFRRIDPRRKLLSLKTHDDLPFYSLYALPKNFKKSKNYPIVVMLYGGTSTYNQEVESGHYMDEYTPNFLLENGFVVLFASFRGKKWLGNTYRESGIGMMHSNGVRDIVTALDSLKKIVKFDSGKINVIGHSRGGHMAAILATRLKSISSQYKVSKTLVSSGVLNPVDGYYNFFEPMSSYNQIEGENLDFIDDDWTGGALCFRPENRFDDLKWERIKEIERKYFEKELNENYKKGKPICNTKAYFNQSPYHHADNLQGEMLILVGDNEEGSLHPKGAFQFQSKAGRDRVQVKVHQYGHGGFYKNDNGGLDFWFSTLVDFFDVYH